MKRPLSRKNKKLIRNVFFLFLIPLVFGFAIFKPFFGEPGIAEIAPMGAYLNGAFPNRVEGEWVWSKVGENTNMQNVISVRKIPRQNAMSFLDFGGRLYKFDFNQDNTTSIMADFTPLKEVNGNRFGFKGFAFHPDFGLLGSPNRNYIYVAYLPNTRDKLISRFTVTDSGTVNLNSELVLIKQRVPAGSYHSYGELAFGKDGFLYIPSGDGSGGNSAPYPSGYDVNTIMNLTQKINNNLLGGILRIDVDKDPLKSHPPVKKLPQVFPSEISGENYWIPNDNPWLDPSGSIMEEYYSIGHRNPWKLTIDELTGTPWVGEVGPFNGEEINKINSGHNYGWPYRVGATGTIVWDDREPTDPEPNPYRGTLTEPVFSPENRNLSTSIILGCVYRGNKWPELYGKILVADQSKPSVWVLSHNNENGSTSVENLPARPTRALSYFESPSGDIMTIGADGSLYKLDRVISETTAIPNLLSNTGAFSNIRDMTISNGILPYTVNTPLWSDNASKKRWIAIPNDGNFNSVNEQIVFSEKEPWEFPEGTVFIKHFELALNQNLPNQKRRLETRFTIVGQQGNIYGVTYRWRPDRSDAELVPSQGFSESFEVTDVNGVTFNQTWEYPSQTDCLSCHNSNAGQSLGVNTQQLNGNFQFPSTGITDNQLNTWNSLNLFNQEIGDPSNFYHNVPLNDPLATNELKVRSYLDANCAYCHRPNGVEAVFDARLGTPLNQQFLLNTAPSSSVSKRPGIIVPGDRQNSELWVRDTSNGNDAMPPIGRSLTDETYIAALEAWIDGLEPNNNIVGEVGTLSLNHNWTRINFKKVYNDPIVITGGLTYAGSQQAMLRIRNVTASGCEIQISEWDCQDGIHFEELASYVVIERGIHELNGGQKIVAGKSSMSNIAGSINFNGTFDEVPLLFGQIQTKTNTKSARVEFQNISTGSFNGRLRSVSEGTITEEVGWLAMEQGRTANAIPYEFKRRENILDTNFNTLNFEQDYGSEAIFIGQTNGMTGGDIINLRHQKLKSKSTEVLIQEEYCSDQEVTHYFKEEVLEYMVFGREGFLNGITRVTDSEPVEQRRLIVQSGNIEINQPYRENWSRVDFPVPMENPAVVLGPVSRNSPDPLTTRIRNITPSGFEVRLEEWLYLDGFHFSESLSWMAVEVGAHRLEDGTVVQAGFSSVDDKNKEVLFDVPFSNNNPLVFAQVSSIQGLTPVSARIKSKSESEFTVALQEEEAEDGIHAAETLSWVAIANLPTSQWQGGELINAVNHTSTRINYNNTLNGRFFAKMQSYLGLDLATVRMQSKDGVSADIFLEEEKSADREVQHYRESVSWLLLEDNLYTAQEGLSSRNLKFSFDTMNEIKDLEQDYVVYPNPVPLGGFLTIELNSMREEVNSIQLFDITGVQVKAFNNEILEGNNTLRLVITDLASGIYILQTEVNGSLRSTKLVVQ